MIPWVSQLELVRALTVHPHACQELNGVLKPMHFIENSALGWIAQVTLESFSEFKVCPTEGQIRTKLSLLPEKIQAATISLLPDVLASEIPPEDWAIKTGRYIAARAELIVFGQEIPELAENGHFDLALTRARQVSQVASDKGEISSGAGTPDEVLARQSETVSSIPTRITRLDKCLPGGGLKRGSMGHVLGKKGGGKSHTLVHLGGSALFHDKRVLHISLEMPTREVRARYDRHILDSWGEEFIQKLGNEYGKLSHYQSHLTILEATKRAITCGGIESAIDRLDIPPDVIIVDYLQLIACGGMSSGQDPGHVRQQALGQMSQDLHIIAQERDIAIWTAYQANRSGIQATRAGNDVLDTTHYAESIAAAWPAEVIISVNQSITEAGSSLGRVYVAENRGGPSMRTIEVKLDWAKSKITDLLDYTPTQQVVTP